MPWPSGSTRILKFSLPRPNAEARQGAAPVTQLKNAGALRNAPAFLHFVFHYVCLKTGQVYNLPAFVFAFCLDQQLKTND